MFHIVRELLGLTCIVILIYEATSFSVEVGEDIEVTLSPTNYGLRLIATRNSGDVLLIGTLNSGKDLSSINCTIDQPKCEIDGSTLSIERIESGLKIVWETGNTSIELQDCFDLPEGVHWYGGPERRVQAWPIEKTAITGSDPYVPKREDNFAVAERYWLNSKGVFIYLLENVPLFVDQNIANENKVCFIAKLQDPYINRTRNILDYRIMFDDDPRAAHLRAINTFLGKPTGHPDPRMISQPIWTTWPKFNRNNLSESVILEFAQEIRDHGYSNGQLEINDKWESCYGSQEFSEDTFSDIVNTVKKLKEMNFRVTLWIHPFVNKDCQNNSYEGIAKGYFVVDENNETKASWWITDNALQIDFTNPEATEWWSARLRKLIDNLGVDSFTFDAGETDYGPQPSVYGSVDPETIPNILTSSYVRSSAKFGNLTGVSSAWRTQDLPVFVKMVEKGSHWGTNNGLPNLVTTLLQMNMNGYTMVLPGTIGGDSNMEVPTPQLLVRWTQAATFMPAMQFSFSPWEITSPNYDVPSIVQKFINLHESYFEVILRAMEGSIKNGTPVNPPIWWIDPTDNEALACDDEFLLGDEILVAPILSEGDTLRNVYLPKGTWRDGNDDTIYEGPISLNYRADINTLPYFIRESVPLLHID